MRIAIGMIMRDFLSAKPLTEFLDNAEKYGHTINSVIVAYSNQMNPAAAKKLEGRTKLSCIRLQEISGTYKNLENIGLRHTTIRQLLFCPLADMYGLVPYGFFHSQVLLEAMFQDLDYLILVGSDIRPCVLEQTADGKISKREIDFIGAHLQSLAKGADLTTSNYSGYSILPLVGFDGVEDLLWGLYREEMADFWKSISELGGIIVQKSARSKSKIKPVPTTKVFAGNLGIRMKTLSNLPTFFSPYYFHNQSPLLAGGLDSLLDLTKAQGSVQCVDIQTPVFRNTYGDYPQKPEMKFEAHVRDIFFSICTGWIGQNVFSHRADSLSSDEAALRKRMLTNASKSLFRYSADRRFLRLPEIQGTAEPWLPNMENQHRKAAEAWDELLDKWLRSKAGR